jgi:hypothetical protein
MRLVGGWLVMLVVGGCAAGPGPLQSPAAMPLRQAPRQQIGAMDAATKPDYWISRGVYPQFMAGIQAKVKADMAAFVPGVVTKYEWGGWTAPDDGELQVKFFGIKDQKTFKAKVLPQVMAAFETYPGVWNRQ